MKKILLIALVLALATIACLSFGTPTQAANCSSFAYKQCISNIVYWYDSCGAVQAVYQNCNTTNQICQNAACVNRPTPTPNPNPNPNPNPQPPQNINDNNSCTVDTCQGNSCTHVLKCDGSTCTSTSADYAKYCQGGSPTPNQPGTPSTPGGQTSSGGIAVVLFAKKAGQATNFQKTLTASTNDSLEFTVVVKNISGNAANNVNLQISLPTSVAYSGNLAIDGTSSAGSVTSGISLGTLAPRTTKIVTFTGNVSAAVQTTQVTTTVTSSNGSDSDTVNLSGTATANPNTAGVSNTTAGAKLFEFVKQWYLWIIVLIIMAVLFVIIFRRLSSPT